MTARRRWYDSNCMPFLRTLVREVARKAAQDPRVRDAAKRVLDNEIKPRAKEAWQKAKPEVEAAWERAKPEVQAAKERTVKKAANIANRVNQRLQKSASDPQEESADPSDKR